MGIFRAAVAAHAVGQGVGGETSNESGSGRRGHPSMVIAVAAIAVVTRGGGCSRSWPPSSPSSWPSPQREGRPQMAQHDDSRRRGVLEVGSYWGHSSRGVAAPAPSDAASAMSPPLRRPLGRGSRGSVRRGLRRRVPGASPAADRQGRAARAAPRPHPRRQGAERALCGHGRGRSAECLAGAWGGGSLWSASTEPGTCLANPLHDGYPTPPCALL